MLLCESINSPSLDSISIGVNMLCKFARAFRQRTQDLCCAWPKSGDAVLHIQCPGIFDTCPAVGHQLRSGIWALWL